MSVQRSIGSNVAAWITRVPPATGSRRHAPLALEARARDTRAGRSTRAAPRGSPRGPARGAGRGASGPYASSRRPATTGRPGPSRSSGKSAADAAGSWSVAQTTPRRGLDEDAPLDRAARRAGGRRGVGTRPRGPDGRPSAQTPIGCQTVFISRKAAIHSGRSAARSSSQSNRASAIAGGRRDEALDVVGGELARPRSAGRPGRPRRRARRRPRGRRGPARAPLPTRSGR